MPADTPVATPLPAPILAILGALLVQTPPAGLEPRDTLEPIQTVVGPVIELGMENTVTCMESVLVQPCASVAVTQYTVLIEGVATGDEQVVQLKLTDGPHR